MSSPGVTRLSTFTSGRASFSDSEEELLSSELDISCVLRLRTQVYRLDGGVELILGVNGFIWIRKATTDGSNPMDVSITKLEQESNASEIYKDVNDPISLTTRQAISRYANCIQALVGQGIGINEERIKAAYEMSLNHSDAADLLNPAVKAQLGEAALA